jgi:hypothetical protein
MSMSYTSENDRERQRLAKLVWSMTEADLQRPISNGWTIATKLAHLAYWDFYALARLKKSEQAAFGSIPVPVDEINEAVRAVSVAIPLKAAAQLAIEAAEAVDAYVEKLTPERAKAIEASGGERLLNRSLHRRGHLDEIEKALGR